MKAIPFSYPKNSTNVRFFNNAGQAWLAQSLGLIHPEILARLAENRFLTPVRFQAPDAEKKFLATGHRFTIRHEGKKLAAWSWGDGPTVFLMHGWAGRGGQLHHFIPELLSAGYSVVLFDALGHGQSEGKQSSLIDFADCLVSVVRSAGPAHAVIAHSMGAAATVIALQRGLNVKQVVLIASPTSPIPASVEFASRLGLSAKVLQKMQTRLEKRFGVRFSDLSVVEAARTLSVKALIVHDKNDRDVAWSEGREIAVHWPQSRFLSTEGLGHRRILKAPEVIRDVVEFLKTEGKPPKLQLVSP